MGLRGLFTSSDMNDIYLAFCRPYVASRHSPYL